MIVYTQNGDVMHVYTECAVYTKHYDRDNFISFLFLFFVPIRLLDCSCFMCSTLLKQSARNVRQAST